MKEIGVYGIDTAFERLKPVAFLPDLGHRPLVGFSLRPGEERRRWLLLRRSHVAEDHSAHLVSRVSWNADLVLEIGFGRLGRHVDATPFAVELPAMVDAANTVLL